MVIAALDVACFVQPSPMPWGPFVPFEASLCGWPKADCRPSFVVFGLKLGLLDRLLRCPIINSVGPRILALGISGPVISQSVIFWSCGHSLFSMFVSCLSSRNFMAAHRRELR